MPSSMLEPNTYTLSPESIWGNVMSKNVRHHDLSYPYFATTFCSRQSHIIVIYLLLCPSMSPATPLYHLCRVIYSFFQRMCPTQLVSSYCRCQTDSASDGYVETILTHALYSLSLSLLWRKHVWTLVFPVSVWTINFNANPSESFESV